LPGFDRSKSKEEVGEEVLKILEEVSDVYLATVKTMYEESPLPFKLKRGISNKEAEKLKTGETYNKIISTSTDETTAKSFSEYGDSALLNITTDGNVPFINVTNFFGAENLDRYENEYILAPFAQVKSSTFRSNWQGYKYYDVELTKPEMKAFEEGEKGKLEEQIKKNFVDIIEIGKKYIKLEDESKLYFGQFQKYSGSEARFCKEKYDETSKEASAIKQKITEFGKIMRYYAQGLCVEKEKEFKLAKKINDENKYHIMLEKRKQEKEARINAYKTEFNDLGKKFSEIMDLAPKRISTKCQALKDEEMKYNIIANKIGISFNLIVHNEQIEPNIEKISQNISNMKDKIEEYQRDGFNAEDSAKSTKTKMNGFCKKAKRVQENEKVLDEYIKGYSKDALSEIKKGVDEKVQQTIKNEKLKLLTNKKQELMNKKISWFGRLRGLGKLRDLELQNINLEEQILRNSTITQKSTYSIRDSLADLRAFSKKEFDGKNTEDMQNLIDNVKQCFGFNDKEVENRANMKLNSVPMVAVENPNKKVRTSKKIANARERNKILAQEVSQVYNSGIKNNLDQYRYNPSSNLNQIYETIKEIALDTVVENEHKNNIIQKPDNNQFLTKGAC
jgi:hypothetical protein